MKSLLAGNRPMFFMTGIMAIEAAIAGVFFTRGIPQELLDRHEVASKEMEAVETELSRIETQEKESRRPLEAMSAMLMMKPEDVDYRMITIGDFHDGDWIHMTLTSKNADSIARYVEVLAANDSFRGIRRTRAFKTGNQISWEVAIPFANERSEGL